MMLAQAVALSLTLPAFVSAALFPEDSLVKQLDPKGFREAMKENVSFLVRVLCCPELTNMCSRGPVLLHSQRLGVG